MEHSWPTTNQVLGVLVKLPCHVMISGYSSYLYNTRLATWHRESYQAVTRGGSLATEYVWMNFPKPDVLHDYRYVGRTYRQRQDLKRKTARWRRRLLEMPMCDRMAILAALEDLNASSSKKGTT